MHKLSFSLLALSLVACEKSAGGGAGGVAKTLSSGAGAPLAAIPAAADVVLGFNAQHLAKAEIAADWVKETPKLPDGTEFDLKKKCNIDVMALPVVVTVGVDVEASNPQVWVAAKGLPGDKLLACVAKEPEAQKNMKIDGNYASFENEGKQGGLLATSDAVYVVVGTGTDKPALEAMAKATSGIGSDKTFGELYAKVDKNSALWVVGLPGIGKSTGENVTAYGDLKFSKTIDLNATIRAPSKEKADALMAQINQVKAMAGMFTSKFEVKADGSDIKFVAQMTKDNMQAIQDMTGMGKAATE